MFRIDVVAMAFDILRVDDDLYEAFPEATCALQRSDDALFVQCMQSATRMERSSTRNSSSRRHRVCLLEGRRGIFRSAHLLDESHLMYMIDL